MNRLWFFLYALWRRLVNRVRGLYEPVVAEGQKEWQTRQMLALLAETKRLEEEAQREIEASRPPTKFANTFGQIMKSVGWRLGYTVGQTKAKLRRTRRVNR